MKLFDSLKQQVLELLGLPIDYNEILEIMINKLSDIMPSDFNQLLEISVERLAQNYFRALQENGCPPIEPKVLNANWCEPILFDFEYLFSITFTCLLENCMGKSQGEELKAEIILSTAILALKNQNDRNTLIFAPSNKELTIKHFLDFYESLYKDNDLNAIYRIQELSNGMGRMEEYERK